MENNIPEGMKKCSKCGEIKPATAEYFNKNGRVGMSSMCRVCSLEYHREYYQKNKDRIREHHREYGRAPVGRLLQSILRLRRKTGATIYLRDMTDEQKEALANQYVAVKTLEKTEKELLAASGKKRCSNCGEIKPATAEYYSRNRTRKDGLCVNCKECVKEFYQKNIDKRLAYWKEYYQKNGDKIRERERKYRQKQKALDKTKSIPDNRD